MKGKNNMKYNILVVADLHWGVMDDYRMYCQYQYILNAIDTRDIDIVVIAGDYFDSKLYLNSKRTIRSLDWFDELFKLCQSRGVQKIRMIRGTLSHDADQMSVFYKYEDEFSYFKVIEKCFSEETLPGLQCLYCPDEIMSIKDYILRYTDTLLNENDIAFFHGSFDVVLRQDINVSKLLYEEPEDMNVITSITFPMNYFQKIIKYCLVGGHWHDGKQYERIYYVGSPTQWIHGEDSPKGIGLISIDTESEEYTYEKILNPIAPIYKSYDIRPDEMINVDNYMDDIYILINNIRESLSQETNTREVHIRIVIYEIDKCAKSQIIIKTLKDAFVKDKNVVIKVKSKNKKSNKKKGEDKPEVKEDLSFIKDKSLGISQQLYEFIQLRGKTKVPLEYIEKLVKKYTQ